MKRRPRRLSEREVREIAAGDDLRLTKTQAFALESAIEHGGIFARNHRHGRHGGAYRRMVERMIEVKLLLQESFRRGDIHPTELGMRALTLYRENERQKPPNRSSR